MKPLRYDGGAPATLECSSILPDGELDSERGFLRYRPVNHCTTFLLLSATIHIFVLVLCLPRICQTPYGSAKPIVLSLLLSALDFRITMPG